MKEPDHLHACQESLLPLSGDEIRNFINEGKGKKRKKRGKRKKGRPGSLPIGKL